MMLMVGESLKAKSKIAIGVARRNRTEDFLGYIVVDLNSYDSQSGERQAFIVDIGVYPEIWNRGIGHKLIDWAKKLAISNGIKFMAGEVSVDNDKVIQASLRCGGKIKSYYISYEL